MASRKERTDNTLRRAGLLERFYITRCQLGFDSVVVVSARYTFATTTTLNRTIVISALKQILNDLPALCVQVSGQHDDKEGPLFVRLPTIDLNAVVEDVADSAKSLEDVMKSQFVRPIAHETALPLWRVVLHGDSLLFCYHHTIGDGQSGLAFHAALYTALNKLPDPHCEQADSPIATSPADMVLPMPVERLTNVSVGLPKLVSALYGVFAPISWQRLHTAWTGNAVVEEPRLETDIRFHTIQPDDAKILLELCRQKQCTLTSFLHALSVLVLSRILNNTDKSFKLKTISTFTAISLRRFTGTPASAVCAQVTSHHAFPRIKKAKGIPYPPTRATFCWGDAAKYNRALRKGLKKNRQVVGTVKFMYLLGIPTSYFMENLGHKREGGLAISNLGRFKPQSPQGNDTSAESPRWKIDDVYFGQCDSVVGAAIKINVVGTPSDAINISYTWGEGSMDRNTMLQFIEGMNESVLSIVEK